MFAKQAPRILCAWCDVLLQDGPLPASHGICDSCFAGFYDEVQRLAATPGGPGTPALRPSVGVA